MMTAKEIGELLIAMDPDNNKQIVVDGRGVVSVSENEGWEDGFIVVPSAEVDDTKTRNNRYGSAYDKSYDSAIIASDIPYIKLVCFNPIEDMKVESSSQEVLEHAIRVSGEDYKDQMDAYKETIVKKGHDK